MKIKEPVKDEFELHNEHIKSQLILFRLFSLRNDKINLMKEIIAYIKANDKKEILKNNWYNRILNELQANEINTEEVEPSPIDVKKEKVYYNDDLVKSKTNRNKLFKSSDFNKYENIVDMNKEQIRKMKEMEKTIGKQFWTNKNTLLDFIHSNKDKSIDELNKLWLDNKDNRIKSRLHFIQTNIIERRGYEGKKELTRDEIKQVKQILNNDENKYSDDEIVDTIMNNRLTKNSNELIDDILESATNNLEFDDERMDMMKDNFRIQYDDYANELKDDGKRFTNNIANNIKIYQDIINRMNKRFMLNVIISDDTIINHIGDRKSFIINEFIKSFINKERITEQQFVSKLGVNKSGKGASSLTAKTLGKGLSKRKDELMKLGDIMIYKNKLYNDNILSIMDMNKQKIPYLKNVKITDELLNIFDKIFKDVKVIASDLKILDNSEKIIYDTVLKLSKNHKKHHNNIDSSIKSLKDRYLAIIGEIQAGNDNNDLINELKDVLSKLVSLKVIPHHQMIKQLKQMNNCY